MNNESIFLSDLGIIEAKVSFPIASALDCAKKKYVAKEIQNKSKINRGNER